MQLGTSSIPLLPAVVVGVAVVLAGLAFLRVRRGRRRPAPVAVTAARAGTEDSDPCAEDWTGEAASGAADPPGPERRPTVGETVAARRAGADPFPAVPRAPESATAGRPRSSPRHALDRPPSDGPATPPYGRTAAAARPAPVAPGRDDVQPPDPVDAGPAHDADDHRDTGADAGAHPGPGGVRMETDADGEPVPDDASRTEAVAAPGDDRPDPGVPAQAVPASGSRALPFGEVPDLAEDTDGLDLVEPGPVPPPWSAARTRPGLPDPSPAPVGVAVRQALAAREMKRARAEEGDGEPDLSQEDRSDARDRLLAVLLTDPVTALGATAQLGDVLRRRRVELATAMRRLHASGLTREQIGRLSGLGPNDVRDLLEHDAGEAPEAR